MTKHICLLTILVLAAFGVGCSTNTTGDSTQNPAQATTSPGPDNSEISTTVDADGTRTETRTFRNNPRVSKVVVTTRKDGTRTVKATSPSGVEKVVDTTEDVLQATGDKVADGAGFVAAEGEKVTNEVGDKAEDVKDKTVSTSKDVGEKTVEGAKTVGAKSVEGAKKVGDKTVEGAKKAGKAVKKVIP